MKLLVLSFIFSSFASAQTPAPSKTGTGTGMGGAFGRVQLNDVNIEGEANSDAMRFSQRDIADISKKLKIRTNFMDRVHELAPRDWKKDEASAVPAK